MTDETLMTEEELTAELSKLFQVHPNVHGTLQNPKPHGLRLLLSQRHQLWNFWVARVRTNPKEVLVFEGPSLPDFHDAKWNDFLFPGGVVFRNVTFAKAASFARVAFESGSRFENVKFQSPVSFKLARFAHNCSFDSVKFFDEADFSCAQFEACPPEEMGDQEEVGEQAESSLFRATTFQKAVTFRSAKFDGPAFFRPNVAFRNKAAFARAKFRSEVKFDGAVFQEATSFYGAVFEGPVSLRGKGDEGSSFGDVSFAGAQFKAEVAFDNRQFKGKTSFAPSRGKERRPVVFHVAPSFYNCDLHQSTDFSLVEFLDTRSSWARKNYETLKHLVGRYQAVREERMFHSLELCSEGHLSPQVLTRALHVVYWHLSEHGTSERRPFLCLVAGSLVLGAVYGWTANLTPSLTCNGVTTDLIGFVALNSSPVPGMDKVALELWKGFSEKETYSGAVALLVMFHRVLAIVSWFLVGLALRNRFRIG